MGRILDARERGVLDALQLNHSKFQNKAALPFGIGRKTLDGLVNLGLLEMGPSKLHYGQVGYRLTPNGWRTMYGMTYEEIMAQPAGKGVRPLRVWSCPPSCDLSQSG